MPHFRRELLTGYELACIRAVGAALDEGSRAVLNEQVQRINKVQRFSNDREVNCYAMRFGKVLRISSLRLPFDAGELPFATVQVASDRERMNATLWAPDGYFFSLTFDSDPRQLGDEPNVSEVRLLPDRFAAFRAPAGDGERDRMPSQQVAHSQFRIPADWQALVGETAGLSIDGVRIHGKSSARTVLVGTEDLVVLAESEIVPWFVVVGRSENAPLVLLLSSDESVRTDCNGSFLRALSLLLRQGRPDQG
jgi:hypothetical protein